MVNRIERPRNVGVGIDDIRPYVLFYPIFPFYEQQALTADYQADKSEEEPGQHITGIMDIQINPAEADT